MIKIIKKKTYEGMRNQIDRLTKQILKQQNELKMKTDTINDAVNDNIYLGEILNDRDKEIKRLKTLCTKNKIDYKVKENKKECKKNKQLEEK